MTVPNGRISLYTMEPPYGVGRAALVSLRGKLLSDIPREELDADFFKILDPAGSDSFLKVSRSTVFRAEGKEDHRHEDNIILCSRNQNDGYINSCGEVVYWGGEPPGFWDEWLALPKYTTNFDAAMRLKSAVLDLGCTIVLEEFENVVPDGDDAMRIDRTFRADIRDKESSIMRGPTVGTPAVAVLCVMLDYLLSFSDQYAAPG